jgi:hypothetical protein
VLTHTLRVVPNARQQRIGVLVVRGWLEDASETPFRARITQTLDISACDDIVILASNSEDVCDAVAAWLAAFHQHRTPGG